MYNLTVLGGSFFFVRYLPISNLTSQIVDIASLPKIFERKMILMPVPPETACRKGFF